MTDPLDAVMRELRQIYLLEAPARLAELRQDAAAFRAGEATAAASLRMRFHRLAGSGGSYGFDEISAIAGEIERWIAAMPPPGPSDTARLDEAIERLSRVFDRAAANAEG